MPPGSAPSPQEAYQKAELAVQEAYKLRTELSRLKAQSADIHLYAGHIKVALPYNNHYLVNTQIGEVTAVSLESGGDRRGGHKGGGVYQPGTVVLVAISQDNADHSATVTHPSIIVGAYAPYPLHTGDDLKTDFSPTSITTDSPADLNHNEIYRLILENDEIPVLNQDRSFNRPLDLTPGDWFKSTVLGGLFFLSEFMSKVGSTKGCNITFHGVDETIEETCKNHILDALTYCKQIINRGRDSLVIESFAINAAEALGANLDTPALIQDDEQATDNPSRLKPVEDLQTAFFRRRRYQGGSVEGSWDTCQTDPDKTSIYKYAADNTYPGTFSEIRHMDGVYRLRAAQEIKFEKRGVILVPVELQEPMYVERSDADTQAFEAEEAKKEEKDSVTQLKDEFGLKDEDEVYKAMPLLHKAYANYQEREIYFKGLRKDAGIWRFPSEAEIEEKLGFPKDAKLPQLDNKKTEYDLEDMAALLTEAIEVYPGRQVKLFKNSSVFLMAEDGGIIIGDGFGGELRMSRGNVTISAAGDVKLTPGRDLIELVPGNRLSRVGDRVEVSSTRGSIALKAQENFQISSGNSSTGGMLTLENRSTGSNLTEITTEALQAGEAIGSGIQIKSISSGVSILGDYLFAGGYAEGSGKSKQGFSSKALTCDIYLDSGQGSTLLTGSAGAMLFEDSASISSRGSATGIYMDSSNIAYVADSKNIFASPNVVIDKGSGSVSKPEMTTAGLRQRRQRLPTSVPKLTVQGVLDVKEGISTKGSILSQGSVRASLGCNDEPLSAGPSVSIDNTSSPQVLEAVEGATTSINEGLDRILQQGAPTEYGMKIAGFAFPDGTSSVYRADKFSLTIPTWQSAVETSETWEEEPVSHDILEKDTYPYPGREIFKEDKKVLISLNESTLEIENLEMSKYKINLKTRT